MTEGFETGNGQEVPRSMFTPRDFALLWRIPLTMELSPEKAIDALRERIKELNCLYGISQLAERNPESMETLLEQIVNFIPYAWQYPDITCARILFHGKTYTSEQFSVTAWRQSARIYEYHEAVGECTIFYLQECPPADEGPFLKEERALLDAIADQIGAIASRISADLELKETNQQLSLEREALRESNTALKIIMARIEQEKQGIYDEINMNVAKILMPILDALNVQVPAALKNYINLLRTNLEDITSPFVSQLSVSFNSLTPTEIAICNMIKSGKTTMEIASMRGISVSTVNRHRENIRKKLKVTNQDINLATYLQSNQWLGKQPDENGI